MIPVEVVDELARVVGSRHVGTDPDVLAPRGIDWMQRRGVPPAVLVAPGSADEVGAVLAICDQHGIGVSTQGGRTSLVAGSVPGADGQLALSTHRLRRVDTTGVASGSVTVGAGVTLAELDAALAASGWRHPIDFGARDAATIGGTVATNAGGIGAFRHGMTRQRILGLEVVLASGARLDHTGAPLKDNSGYSLDALVCGSEGTLAVVTAATLRLAPRPAVRATAVVGVDDVDGAMDLAWTWFRRGEGLEAVEYLSGRCLEGTTAAFGHPLGLEAPHLLLVELGGEGDVIDALAALLEDTCGGSPTAMATSSADRAAMWLHRDRIGEMVQARGPVAKFDLSLPGDGFATMVREADTLSRAGEVWCFGHACDHNLHLNVSGVHESERADLQRRVFERVLELGGSVAAEHGIGRTKVEWLDRTRSPQEVSAMRALKAALDPNGILNPGVLFG